MSTLNKQAQEFLNLVNGGNYKGAVLKLRNDVDMEQSLWACDKLSSDVLDNLKNFCSPGLDGRLRFVIDTVRDLVMPQKLVMSYRMDYHEARKFLLKKLANPKTSKKLKVPYPKAAYEHLFYPDYLAADGARERVRLLAENHLCDNAKDEKQKCFFSLGGCFSWDNTITTPGGEGTTCGMFIRACLFAAGCRQNDSWHSIDYTISSYIGLNGGTKNPAFVKFDSSRQPKVGDIFWIHKGLFPGTTKDDSHVGIIVSINGNVWKTVEGGQDKDKTYSKTRELVIEGNAATFKDDSFKRPIQGWVDIDRYKWGTWTMTYY